MKNIKQYILFAACPILMGTAAFAQPGADEIIQATEDAIEALENGFGDMEGFEGGVSPAIEAFEGAMDGVSDALELYDAMQALDNNECVPDFTTPAEAMMPSGCAGDPGCASCYQGPIGNMNTVRRSLSRMSCIYHNTKRFTEAAISFGDNVSGIHGVMGLAWQNERRGIEQALIDFERTYDNKYKDLMVSLQNSLNAISRCEAQHGMENWYQRFGFMYFEMMKEKYKRTD